MHVVPLPPGVYNGASVAIGWQHRTGNGPSLRPALGFGISAANPPFFAQSEWALRDSNPRPQPCEGCAKGL